MMNRNVELINIARIDLLKGKTNINLDSLSQILLDNYATKFDKKDLSFYYEDSYCPPNDYVDTIIEEMKTDFFAATQEKIEVTNYWGHIHEKNMSTTLHNHDKAYVSAVVYLKIPKGSGKFFDKNLKCYNRNFLKSKPIKLWQTVLQLMELTQERLLYF